MHLSLDASTPKQVLKAMRAAKSDAAKARSPREAFKKRPDGRNAEKAEIEKPRGVSKASIPLIRAATTIGFQSI